MSVVTFPNMARVGAGSAPPLEVIVAPLGGDVVAWVRSSRGCSVLEQTPDWRHALKDGRTYADRHGIPLRFQSDPLDTGRPERSKEEGGTLYLDPSDRHGGSWDIVHLSRSQDSAAIVGNAFSFEEASAEARRIAAETGATLYEGPSGGAA